MNAFDVVVVLLALSAVLGGYRLGFVARVTSWVGMAAGLVLGVAVLPFLLDRLAPGDPAGALLLTVGVIGAGAFAGQAAGFVVGARLRPADEDGSVTPLDGAFGALAGVVGMVMVVWLLLPVLTGSDGWVGGQVRASGAARELDRRLPDPPDAVEALRGFVGEDRFPEVFAALEPTPDLGPPPEQSGLDSLTAARVARSVVKVEGTACRQVQHGTGFVAAPGLVVTNAHVVAGENSTELHRDDGTVVGADVVAFDPDRDLAVLRAPDIDRPVLEVGVSGVGLSGGVFGHPGGGPLRIAPFSVARELEATGRDIYGTGIVDREVLELASTLRPGDSGAALVTPDGLVVGVAFAIARDRPAVAYALSTGELDTVLQTASQNPVDTGRCLP